MSSNFRTYKGETLVIVTLEKGHIVQKGYVLYSFFSAGLTQGRC